MIAAPVKPRYLRLSIMLAIIIAGLFGIDRLLAKLEVREVHLVADQHYAAGTQALQQHDNHKALLELQRAHAMERTRRDVLFALSDALAANGETDQAEANLREMLADDSNDGRANLLLARLLARKSRTAEAIAYFHRAIYGTWDQHAASEVTNARLELARYLAQQHRPQELLSELLLLQQYAPKELRYDIAELLLASGASARAEQSYRDLLRDNPHDARAYRGLGDANILEGDFRGAESMFLRALQYDPSNASIAAHMKFANQLALLDPTPRRLRSAEKYARAETLVDSIGNELAKCRGAVPDASSPKPAMRTVTNEQAEEKLALAEDLWQQRIQCHPDTQPDDPTAIIMQKVLRTR